MPAVRTRKTSQSRSRVKTSAPTVRVKVKGDGQLQLFRAVLNASPDAILLIDGESGRILFANESAAKNLGYPRDVLVKMSAMDIEAISPGNFEWTQHVQRVRKAGTLTIRTRHMRQDGTTFPVEVDLSWMPHEGGLLVATARDITQQRRVEADLLAGQDLLAIVKLLPDVIFRCEKGRDGRIYWAFNEGRLAEEFQLTTQNVKGKPLEALFPPPVVAKLLPEFEAAFRGEAREFVNELSGRYFKHFPQPVRGPDGKVVAVVGFISEVTSLVKAEQEIGRLNLELTAKVSDLATANKDLESYTYSVSHDLRTPLAVLDTMAQALNIKYGPTLDEAGRDGLKRLRTAVDRMNQIINDLLVLSRVGRHELKRTRVDLSTLCRNVESDLRKRWPNHNVELTVAPDLFVEADEGLTRTVVENLLSNAWKYTSKRPDARVTVGASVVDGRSCYFVRDNGVGFDSKTAARLFEPFVRLHAASEYEGTGVGLAIVQRVVRRHGGAAWADARPDEGATFYVSFGASGPPTSTAPSP